MATEVKQRNNRVFVLVGAVVAVAAFLAVIFISRNNNSTSTASTTIVVAKTDLPQGHQLIADDLTTASYSNDNLPGNYIVDSSTLVGKYTAVTVTAKQPMTASLIVSTQAQGTQAALGAVPLNISKNYVAFAIPAGADVQQVACNIHAEDRFDIIIDSGNGTFRYSFQDVRVLQTYPAAAACPSLYVVEMPRAQAEQMTFLFSGSGPAKVVKFVLRPHTEYGKNGEWPDKAYEGINDPNSTPVTADSPVNAASFNALFPAGR